MPKHRDALPQLGDEVFLTDGGLETSLIFNDGIELPDFAAFPLLADEGGREALRRYYQPYVDLALAASCGFVLESPTWRANQDWATRLGFSPAELAQANAAAINLMVALRDESETPSAPFVVSGCVGPRGDGYNPVTLMTADEAQAYHAEQIGTFAETDADLVTAMTLTHSAEAVGVAAAAQAAAMPCVISFTVETDGSLPSGESLGQAITAVDDATDSWPSSYMVNCAHPTHFASTLDDAAPWMQRIRGLRANASTRSHAELDEAEQLDVGDPADLGQRYADLRSRFSQITTLGGCCGTDIRHLSAIREACWTS